ncbi:MAG: malonyl-CoA/methylmalonyl-CoA synthetase [Parasphingorhabdus sp.]|jgi:malonyl-CoA/methylmalonyl-CoA synthetase
MYTSNYLASKLRLATLDRPDAVFARIHETGEIISYADFFEASERLASAMVSAGVKPGDRVAMQVKKSIHALQLYMATILAGGVFLPLNTAYTAKEVSYFLGDAEPALFVCDPERYESLVAVAQQCGVATVWTLSGNGEGTLIDAQRAANSGFEAVSRQADDLAAILYTSGTTGRSKGAMLSHNGLASNAEVLQVYWEFNQDDVLIHALPIFHTHGLFVATNITMTAGSAMIFMASYNAEAIIDYMLSATVLMGVPTFYVRLLEQAELANAAANMRLFVSGSAPLLAETHHSWSRVTGHAILERYGMTETNMNTSNPYHGERIAGTVGFPLPGVEVVITDPQTAVELSPGEIGILEVRGPNVFMGYWRMPEKTAEELRSNGFFITGDLGLIDDKGYVQIVGRDKDLIISGGYNIYPKEIELLIDDLPGVKESAVIGVAHPDFGEAVVAVIVPAADQKLDEDNIVRGLQDDLARFKQPKRLFFVDELPRNAMGKVQKNLLRDRYASLFTD